MQECRLRCSERERSTICLPECLEAEEKGAVIDGVKENSSLLNSILIVIFIILFVILILLALAMKVKSLREEKNQHTCNE